MVLCSPEKSRGEGLSKQQKTTESPPSDGESVLDGLAALSEEVKQLQEEVTQQGEGLLHIWGAARKVEGRKDIPGAGSRRK